MARADLVELGVLGVATGVRGRVFQPDEMLPELADRRGLLVYRQMRETDPVVSSVFLAIEQVMSGLEWVTVPESDDPEARRDAEFVESNREDMSHTWADFIRQVVEFLQYGFSVFEIVYKIRAGGTDDDPAHRRSRYSDGRMGWRKFAYRHPQTIVEWVMDESGGVRGLVQQDPMDGRLISIPVQKLLHFKTRPHGGNPFGFSLLRGAYRPWKFKKYLEEVEGIGVERDLAGLPLIECPDGVDIFAPENEALFARLKEVLQNVRRDKYEGVVMPAGFKFSLVASSGTKQFDTNRIINRYDQRIALSVLAQFVLLGVERVGSYALASQQRDLFTAALEGWLIGIESVINRFGVARLVRLNGLSTYPRVVHRPIVQPTTEELALILSRLVQVGVLSPDSGLERWVRSKLAAPMDSGMNGETAARNVLQNFDESDHFDDGLRDQIAEIVGEEKADEVVSVIRGKFELKREGSRNVRRQLVDYLMREIVGNATP